MAELDLSAIAAASIATPGTGVFAVFAESTSPAKRLSSKDDAGTVTNYVGAATTDTLTNKTLTAPVIATITNSGTITLPTGPDTLVGRATTDTLTNKIINKQSLLNNFSTASQAPTTAVRTYIAGSLIAVPVGSLQIGTMFMWSFNMTKTAAGTAASTIDVAIGTNGTTADAAVLSFTKPAGTAAVDEGFVSITAIIRGPLSASCIAVGEFTMMHNGNTVGHATIPCVVVNTVSSAFNATTAGLKVGLCITTGALDAITIQQVTAQAWNL